MSSPCVVIQLIHCTWTKASRGGDGARLRNALPLQLPLPLDSFAAPVTLHRVAFSEFTDFDRRETVERYDTLGSLRLHDLSFQLCGDSLVVGHIRDQQNAAIADRLYPDESGNTVFEIDAFCVASDEWGQTSLQRSIRGRGHGQLVVRTIDLQYRANPWGADRPLRLNETQSSVCRIGYSSLTRSPNTASAAEALRARLRLSFSGRSRKC